MPVSAISFYKGGTVEDVTPLASRMKAVLRKYGIDYQLSRLQTGQNVGEWLVVVRYADWTAFARAQDGFGDDPDHRQVITEISRHVTLMRRELAVDLDL